MGPPAASDRLGALPISQNARFYGGFGSLKAAWGWYVPGKNGISGQLLRVLLVPFRAGPPQTRLPPIRHPL
jgi:hypothetical protein